MSDLTELEARLHAWIVASDFETVAWSSKDAAKAFSTKDEKVTAEDIRIALAALTVKLPNQIQISYSNGAMHVAAE